MDINIDPQAVNQLVADAILKSTLGAAVKAAVEKETAKLSASWDNPLEHVIRNHVSELARDVLAKEYGPALRARMADALASKMSDQFIADVCEKIADKYTR